MDRKAKKNLWVLTGFTWAMGWTMTPYDPIWPSLLFAGTGAFVGPVAATSSIVRNKFGLSLTYKGLLAVSLCLGIVFFIVAYIPLSNHAQRERTEEEQRTNQMKAVSDQLTRANKLLEESNKRLQALETQISALTKIAVQSDYPSSKNILSLPRYTDDVKGQAVTFNVADVQAKIKLLGASQTSFHYDIEYLKASRLDATNNSLIVSPGQPVSILARDDFSLVASVIKLEAGVYVPWLGLVPSDNAPRVSFFTQRGMRFFREDSDLGN